MKKHLIRAAAALLTLLCLPLSAAAAHPVPDPARDGNCTVTITMKYKDKLISGGSVNLYKVGDVLEDDGNYSFVPVAAVKATIPAFADIQSPELAEDLAKLESKLTPVTETPVSIGGNGQKGIAEFRNLPFGLYLVVQKTAASGYGMIKPFLVSVPYLTEEGYCYDLKTVPKTDLEQEPQPTKPPEHSDDDGGAKLAQTGQLWWPVPVLVCGGLGCIAVGLIRRREGSE